MYIHVFMYNIYILVVDSCLHERDMVVATISIIYLCVWLYPSMADVRSFAQSQINVRQYISTDGCHLTEERQARYGRGLRQAILTFTMLAPVNYIV